MEKLRLIRLVASGIMGKRAGRPMFPCIVIPADGFLPNFCIVFDSGVICIACEDRWQGPEIMFATAKGL